MRSASRLISSISSGVSSIGCRCYNGVDVRRYSGAVGGSIRKLVGRAVRRPITKATRKPRRGAWPPDPLRVRSILEGLEELYPDVDCELDRETPFQLLCATILSAQCTDERVN